MNPNSRTRLFVKIFAWQAFFNLPFILFVFYLEKNLPKEQWPDLSMTFIIFNLPPALYLFGRNLKSLISLGRGQGSPEIPITEIPQRFLVEFEIESSSMACVNAWALENKFQKNVASKDSFQIFQKGGLLLQPIVIAISNSGGRARVYGWVRFPKGITVVLGESKVPLIPLKMLKNHVNALLSKFDQPKID